jgi:two-component system NtrC family response regulator
MEDLELFVAAFLDEFNQAMGRSVERVNPETYRVMRQYDWPGNIRELRNVIERAMLLCEGDEIQPAHLPAELGAADLSYAAAETPGPEEELPSDGLDLKGVVTELERHYIEKAMERTSGNQTEAAKLLSISRDQLRYRLEKYDLD